MNYQMFRNLVIIIVLLVTGCIGQQQQTIQLTEIPNASVKGCYIEEYRKILDSPYILPYQVSASFQVSQGNCGPYTHQPVCKSISSESKTKLCGDLRYAYDFAIPIGENIHAARSGMVIETEERFSNSAYANGQENYISIQHKDGTVAVYVHLSPKGALVDVGDKISQGDLIGIAGNSGFTGGVPHLHFHVIIPPFDQCRDTEYSGCKTIPVTFRNAVPQDSPLLAGVSYKAAKFSVD